MLHTFTETGYDAWKELAGEMVELLAAVLLLRPAHGVSSSMTSTSVPDVGLAFFLRGAAATPEVFLVCCF